ncbi:MAG: adenosine kinase [FCB group bacterium]|jgi:sugar/nucleoside kinase (ribokinase family)
MAINKDIDLCGLGNALVDLQIEISDDVIASLETNKGEMRLVDSISQKKIIESLSHLKTHKSSGGSAANTIIAFSQFGGKAAYLTSLGDDEFGLFYSNEFLELGINLEASKHKTEPTGTCLVLITPDAERTMLTSLGASALFDVNNILEESIARSKWIYIEGYTFSQDTSTDAVFKAIEFAKSHDTKISLTFSDVFIINLFKKNLAKVVAASDLLFCNDSEAMSYTGKGDVNEAFLELGEQCPNVVLTCGAKGSMVKWNNEHFSIPSYKTKSIDTTGAGDMYAGAFLYGMLYSGSIEKAGNLASYAASRIVSQFGARLSENPDEIKGYILK